MEQLVRIKTKSAGYLVEGHQSAQPSVNPHKRQKVPTASGGSCQATPDDSLTNLEGHEGLSGSFGEIASFQRNGTSKNRALGDVID